jgi:uncharacterized protein YjlB
MNPKTPFSKTTAIVATLLLTVFGSVVSVQPASAVPAVTNPSVSSTGLVAGQTNPNPILVSMTSTTAGVSDYVSVKIPTDWTWVSPVDSASGTTLAGVTVTGFPFTFRRTSNPPLRELFIRNNGTFLSANTTVTIEIGAGLLNVGSSTDFTLSFGYPTGSPTVPVANDLSIVSVGVSSSSQSTEQVTRSVERSIPTSVFQAPILNSLAPKMAGGFSSTGGRLVMKDVKPADISSVMLNGKKVEVIASKSGSALRIPAGAGAGDLTFTMADGTVLTVANAVKITPSQVDPKLVDLNPLPTFKAGSVAVPAAIKSALNKRKAIILDSASAKCVGYASSNTAAARATALSRASNVCGVITDINENIEPIVKVLVNKTVAKKSPVKYQTW